MHCILHGVTIEGFAAAAGKFAQKNPNFSVRSAYSELKSAIELVMVSDKQMRVSQWKKDFLAKTGAKTIIISTNPRDYGRMFNHAVKRVRNLPRIDSAYVALPPVGPPITPVAIAEEVGAQSSMYCLYCNVWICQGNACHCRWW